MGGSGQGTKKHPARRGKVLGCQLNSISASRERTVRPMSSVASARSRWV